jgi:acetolactate synthase small subunit
MCSVVSARVPEGMDAMIRVMSVLRRKTFQIRDMHLVPSERAGFSDLFITLEDRGAYSAERAVHFIEKLEDVQEIKLIREE